MFKHITNILNICFLCFLALNSTLWGQAPFQDRAIEFDLIHTYDDSNGGGGVSCVDFNGDGIDDISLASSEGEPIKFYLNLGQDVFQELNLIPDNLYEIKQILWVDYDNDGDKDLWASAFDGINKLYRNDGELELIDVSVVAGIPQDSSRSMGANFADYNRDGWLDLYYCERSLLGDNSPNENRLFKNKADGTFEEVTQITNSSDIGRLPFCSVFADFNNDNWPDIYIANDRSRRNTLLINFEGFYVDASVESGAGLEMEAMCTTIGDYNKDGFMDVYISNIISGNKFLVNNPDSIELPYPVFDERAEELGITVNSICWGSILFDYDNDKDLDLYVSSSLVGSDTTQSTLFNQIENHQFQEEEYSLIGDTVSSFNNAIGDFNQDGFSDIIVLNKFPFNFNYWENQKNDNHWIKIKPEGVLSNKDGIGVKLELYIEEDYQQLYTTSAISFFGQNSDTYTFGLSQNNFIDSLIVTWPTGHIDRFTNLQGNHSYNIYEGQSTGDTIYVDNGINIAPSQIDTSSIDTISTVSDIFKSRKLTCSPNPAYSEIYIDLYLILDNYDIQAIDINGIAYNLKGAGQSLNIGSLKRGFYVLKISSYNEIFEGRFIKID